MRSNYGKSIATLTKKIRELLSFELIVTTKVLTLIKHPLNTRSFKTYSFLLVTIMQVLIPLYRLRKYPVALN